MKNNYLIDISLLSYQKPVKLKKQVRILLAGLLLIMILIYIYLIISEQQHFIIGIWWILYGLIGIYTLLSEKHFLSIIGNAYIRISDKLINYKLSPFKRAISISWDKITDIEFKPSYILLKTKEKNYQIPFSSMEFSSVQNVKDTITKLFNEKSTGSKK